MFSVPMRLCPDNQDGVETQGAANNPQESYTPNADMLTKDRAK